MKTFFKWLGITSLVIVVLIAGFFISMRFHDGPRGIISGGEFQTGELTVAPDNWDFIKDRTVIEFQTMDPATSRVVWVAVDAGKLYFLSGCMTTGFGKIWKQWPHYLEADDRVILRIDGQLYEQ